MIRNWQMYTMHAYPLKKPNGYKSQSLYFADLQFSLISGSIDVASSSWKNLFRPRYVKYDM